MLKIKSVLCFLLALGLSACITAQGDVDRLQMQLRTLERQHYLDKQRMEQQLETYREQLAAHIESVEGKISETGGPVQTTQAHLWAEMESLRFQVATMSGNLGALERRVAGLQDEDFDWSREVESLQKKTIRLDRALKTLASRLDIDISEEMEAVIAQDRPAPGMEEGVETAQALYQRALDSFYDRRYDQAQSLWEEFAENFPEHDLISNAYFWQGECFYQLQDYAQAVVAYQEVLENYPESNKITASMLKQGMSFINLGRKDAGKLVLDELIQKYPQTAEARRAKAFLSEHGL